MNQELTQLVIAKDDIHEPYGSELVFDQDLLLMCEGKAYKLCISMPS